MKPQLKDMHSIDVDNLEAFKPEIDDNFSLRLSLLIGPQNQPGEESFDVFICTPKWLLDNMGKEEIIIGRHYLIVSEFNFTKIKDRLLQFIHSCEGENWKDCAMKLSRLGYWEFEDYQEFAKP